MRTSSADTIISFVSGDKMLHGDSALDAHFWGVQRGMVNGTTGRRRLPPCVWHDLAIAQPTRQTRASGGKGTTYQ